MTAGVICRMLNALFASGLFHLIFACSKLLFVGQGHMQCNAVLGKQKLTTNRHE